ncbi:MAG: hypothetical protein DLM72_14525 [Candidatus Nitrosopolaris wilkensis]|nr:MAG: hypothetical protein DLM72_14525 [Candidatus Nitrosopolaris wilkensis]
MKQKEMSQNMQSIAPSLITTIVILLVSGTVGLASAATVTQEKVDTGNHELDKQINSFYKCISDTHKDPPRIEVVDQCFTDNFGNGNSDNSINLAIPDHIPSRILN